MDPTVEAAVIGAAAALIGVGGTVIVAISGNRNARRTNQATIDAARADALLMLETTREAQFADRYSRALEQIGSDNLNVRIGGIYALEGIALDSPRHHPTVMEVLTAFVREHSRTSPDAEKPERWPLPDVQTTLTVVGRRRTEHDIHPLDFRAADLSGMRLISANFNQAIFVDANLTSANLAQAQLAASNLSGAKLAHSDLSNADFTKANLRAADLHNANLMGADFTDANLQGAKLVSPRIFSTKFIGADLANAHWIDGVRPPEGWTLVTDTDVPRGIGLLQTQHLTLPL